MQVEHLVLKNFNGRRFEATFYGLQDNPNLCVRQRPLIIVIPGGSFDHLALREGEPVALAYAARGYNAAVLSYNLVQEGVIYPDAALSGLTLLKYFKDHAEKYRIDPEKIVTIGFSAGGHVASMINVFAVNAAFGQKYHFDGLALKPAATILGYPLIDIDKIGFELTEDQRSFLPKEAILRNSAVGVTEQTPPTFLFHAWDDPVVLITNALSYLTALQEKGVLCEAHLFDRGGHGYSLGLPEMVTKGRAWQDNPHISHWLELSLEWLGHVLPESETEA